MELRRSFGSITFINKGNTMQVQVIIDLLSQVVELLGKFNLHGLEIALDILQVMLLMNIIYNATI